MFAFLRSTTGKRSMKWWVIFFWT